MKKTNVLIIDDNKKLVTMIEEYFKDNQNIAVPLVAYDGEEGLKLIEEKQDQYDVILLDLIMPKKDGMQVLRDMRDKNLVKKV